jgi:hypothetical protein
LGGGLRKITLLLNPDRLVFTVSTTGAPSSIVGIDYVRRMDGVNPTV